MLSLLCLCLLLLSIHRRNKEQGVNGLECPAGLDPSSRRLLWDVIRGVKSTAAVVLTTHSMEEAEALCDRIGIFVHGKLSCIGNPQVTTTHCPDPMIQDCICSNMLVG